MSKVNNTTTIQLILSDSSTLDRRQQECKLDAALYGTGEWLTATPRHIKVIRALSSPTDTVTHTVQLIDLDLDLASYCSIAHCPWNSWTNKFNMAARLDAISQVFNATLVLPLSSTINQ